MNRPRVDAWHGAATLPTASTGREGRENAGEGTKMRTRPWIALLGIACGTALAVVCWKAWRAFVGENAAESVGPGAWTGSADRQPSLAPAPPSPAGPALSTAAPPPAAPLQPAPPPMP